MKIAYDAKRALNNGTGLGNHARILLNAIMRDFPNNTYRLFTPHVSDDYFHQLQGKFKMVLPKKKWHKAFPAVWRSYGLTEQLMQSRIDIYHGLSNELPFNIHRSKIKTVVTIHDLIFLKHKAQYPIIDRQFYKLKTRYAARHADKIIAVSNETKHDLIERYRVPEEKVEVIYPSVEPMFYRRGEISEKDRGPSRYLLNVGSFYPRKNQKMLIEAYALIADKVEEDLWLIGEAGAGQYGIVDLINEKGLRHRVKIITNVSSHELPSMYQRATAFVFPSLFEGFGAPVLEALFSGAPVIASKGGAIEEAAGKHSVFINPHSAEDMAEKMLGVIKDEALRNKMISEGYLHAQTMTDTVFAEKTMKVYQSL